MTKHELELRVKDLTESAYAAIELINKPRNEGVFSARTVLAEAIKRSGIADTANGPVNVADFNQQEAL